MIPGRMWIAVAATMTTALLLAFPPYNYYGPLLTKVGWRVGPVTSHHFVMNPPTQQAVINTRNLLAQLTAVIIGFSVLMILSYETTKAQKIVLAVGVISVLAMAAVPPWKERVDLDDGRFVTYDCGYSLSYDQRIKTRDFTGQIRVNFPRLYAQFAAVVVATGIGIFLAGGRNNAGARLSTLPQVPE